MHSLRGCRSRVLSAICPLVGVLLLAAPANAQGAPPLATPVLLPEGLWSHFLSNLSVPSTAPGNGVSLTGTAANPLNGTLFQVTLTIEVYAFAPFPGNTTQGLPRTMPSLSAGGATGFEANLTWGSLLPGVASSVQVSVVVPSGSPPGAFLLRTSLSFSMGSSYFRLASRGFFGLAEWENATQFNGTVNASRLNVSGVTPETAVEVENPLPPYYLYPLLGVSIVLAGAGSYVAFRTTQRSKSGTRDAGPEKNADTALGKRRTKDGD